MEVKRRLKEFRRMGRGDKAVPLDAGRLEVWRHWE
jgi:hypothetical protein